MTATPDDIMRLDGEAYHRGIGLAVEPQAKLAIIAAEIEAVEAIVGPKANTEVVLLETRTDVISTLRRIDTITGANHHRVQRDR